MSDGELFIKAAPDVTLDIDGAHLTYISGGERYYRFYSLPVWREFIGREALRLQEFDRAAAKRVVPIRPKKDRARH